MSRVRDLAREIYVSDRACKSRGEERERERIAPRLLIKFTFPNSLAICH